MRPALRTTVRGGGRRSRGGSCRPNPGTKSARRLGSGSRARARHGVSSTAWLSSRRTTVFSSYCLLSTASLTRPHGPRLLDSVRRQVLRYLGAERIEGERPLERRTLLGAARELSAVEPRVPVQRVGSRR